MFLPNKIIRNKKLNYLRIGNWSWAGTRVTWGLGIHSRYHYKPRCPTLAARHETQVNLGGIDLVTSNLQQVTS